jgi:hypothetical protein
MAVVVLALPASAQVGVGDNVKLNLSGDLSTGYTGNYGNTQVSSHSLDFGGSGALHGYYYNPQFLSFDVQPYYNRSQANSAYQSITDSSGIVASTNIFSGSRFPGSVSFSRSSNSTGQFGLPSVTGLSTDGNSDNFVVNWAALLPGLPTLNLSFMAGREDDSLFGTDSRTHSFNRSFNLHSDYRFRGFLMNGFYLRQSNDRQVPSFLVNDFTENASESQSTNSSIGGMISHPIVMHGYWSASVTHTGTGTDTKSGLLSGVGDGNSNTYSTTASVQPIRNLGVSFGASYQDNLFGALQQQLAEAGSFTALRSSDLSSQALILRGTADYQLFRNVRLNGQINHTEEYLNGKSIGLTQYGGGVSTTYSRALLGSLTFSVGAVDTATQAGNSGASMYGTVGYSRRFGRWETGADANYSQQVQTLANIYTTSMYGYGGTLKRKFGDRLYWTNSARQSHSGLTQNAGTRSQSQSYLTQILYRKYSVNAVYSQSDGAAVLTSQGLVPVPGGIPTPLITSPVLYNATSYGGGVTATVTRLNLSASYSKALSQTVAAANSSNNSTVMFNGLLRIRMRKLYFNAGFTRFQQSVSAAGIPPGMLNSYFFGVSRWFNVF